MFIADALSRSYRLTTDDAQHDSNEVRALREVHHTDGLSVLHKPLEEFKLSTTHDPEMQLLTSQIQKGGHQAVKNALVRQYHTTKTEAS